MLPACAALALAAAFLGPAAGLENGLARTPPMGYSTWNDMQCKVNESAVQRAAEALLSLGLRDLGYHHVNVDDCWMEGQRSPDGALQPQTANFPAGMAAMGDFLHGKGFKFGLYTSRGSGTCCSLAGSLGHELEDAKLFVSWGVDFLKNDGCCDTECYGDAPCGPENRRSVLDKYRKMRDGLNSTGRPVLYEVCGWNPWYAPVGGEISNMFRVGADVQGWADVYEATHLVHQLGHHSREGGWVHPDMLIGSTEGANFRLLPMQSRSQFTLWAIFPAPLILGAHLPDLSAWDLETYSNPEVIQVNQDPLALRAERILSNCGFYDQISVSPDGYSRFAYFTSTDAASEVVSESGGPFYDAAGKGEDRRQCQQVWAKPLQDGSVALAAVNFAREAAELDLPLPQSLVKSGVRRARDLWARKDLLQPGGGGAFRVSMAPDGGHAMLRLWPAKRNLLATRSGQAASATLQLDVL